MRVLLTGATGFIGGRLLPEVARDHEVVALVRRVPGTPPPNVEWLVADLERLDPAAMPPDIETVIHEASRIDDPFGRDPTVTELAGINVQGMLRLLEWASVAGVRRFVYGSTGGIVGAGPPGSFAKEGARAAPPNPYNLTKHLAEQAMLSYAWPFEVCSLRYYAPYAREGSNPWVRHVLGQMERGEPVACGPDDGPWRNPIHISDTVELTIRAVTVPQLPRVVNVAGPEPVSLVQFVELLGRAVGLTPRFLRSTDPPTSWLADITVLERTLGRPRMGVAEGDSLRMGTGPGSILIPGARITATARTSWAWRRWGRERARVSHARASP